jgi:hypothetical protein
MKDMHYSKQIKELEEKLKKQQGREANSLPLATHN